MQLRILILDIQGVDLHSAFLQNFKSYSITGIAKKYSIPRILTAGFVFDTFWAFRTLKKIAYHWLVEYFRKEKQPPYLGQLDLYLNKETAKMEVKAVYKTLYYKSPYSFCNQETD